MNIFQKIKVLFQIKELLNLIKGDRMKALFKSWVGIFKVLTYIASALALVLGYLPVDIVVKITLVISALTKIAEIAVGLTPSKVDDARVAEIIKMLKEQGIIKV